MKKNKTVWTFFCAALALSAAVLLARLFIMMTRLQLAQAKYSVGPVIIIDAGHGGFDPGAEYGGVAEKDINLEIALLLNDFFTAEGYTTILTRSCDTSTSDPGLSTIREQKRSDLRNRAALANSVADAVYISIHQNAFSDHSQWGAQVFYGRLSDESSRLADAVQGALVSFTKQSKRQQTKGAGSSVYIAENISCPMIIVECGFISNDAERAKLLEEDYCAQLAFAIYSGYAQYEATLQIKDSAGE